MSTLWAGGEDTSFPVGGLISINTGAACFRAGYARCGIYGNNTHVRTKAFPGGAVTSCWLTGRAFPDGVISTGFLIFGLINTSTPSSGLWIGLNTGSTSQLALYKYNGATATVLQAETGNSLSGSLIHRIDIQLVNYGATATVNVYCDGTLIIVFGPADCTIGGLTNLDGVGLYGWSGGATKNINCSEFIVADEDIRALNVQTLAATGVGTTDDWTAGTLSNLNATTLTDATPYYTNTAAKDEQFNWTDLVAGTWNIKAIKIEVRACKSSGSPTPTKLKLGYNNGGSVTVGSAQALDTGYGTIEQLDQSPFVQADMNALQLDIQSST